jgi:putative transcriptional regulator
MPPDKPQIMPRQARNYFILAAFFLLLPSFASIYHGHSGKVLVATEKLHGTRFEKTVIFLGRHRLTGSQGVVVNDPAPGLEFRQEFPELAWNMILFDGGPLHYGARHFLLLPHDRDPAKPPSMISTVQLANDNPDLYETLSQRQNEQPARLYTGFAGWGAFQLNQEIWGDYWYVIDYDPALFEQMPAGDLWPIALEKAKKEQEIQRRLDRL